jgi:hypothetical protein
MVLLISDQMVGSRGTPPQEAQHHGSKISSKKLQIDHNRALERATANSVSYRAKTGLMTVGCTTRIKEEV